MIDASSSARRGSGFTSSSVRNSCSLACSIAGRAIAADADADGPGTAALALRLPHRVEDALLDALEVPIGAAEMRQLDGHRVLRVRVLAASPFQDQLISTSFRSH
jgi:hypothetical protein